MMKKYNLDELLLTMRQLRDPETGCPWDLEQTPQTLIKYTLEECYELIDAIEEGCPQHVCEELGDVLLQLVFYSQLASEQGDFTFDDVVNGLTQKLIRRHPHVFSDEVKVSTSEDVLKNWDEIKKTEREDSEKEALFDNIPLAFPALLRAPKLQKRAKKVGFDFTSTSAALEQLKEEIKELEDAIASQQSEAVFDELGDVLFSCANVSRHLKMSPEDALRAANQKFMLRMQKIEALLQKQSLKWEDLSEKDRDSYWSLVK